MSVPDTRVEVIDPQALEAAGWRSKAGQGFNVAVGPFWMRGRDAEREVGLIVREQHTNNAGRMHGGALMTFADISLGSGAGDALGHKYCVTAQMNVQFVSGAHVGEFVVCRPELVRRSAQLVFMRGLITVADRAIASAEGIWKELQAK
ncbi:MAG: PaaI family thioesterase [Nevskia sp.]|nr:PaaI family thioesterase [Nevskia sp.]